MNNRLVDSNPSKDEGWSDFVQHGMPAEKIQSNDYFDMSIEIYMFVTTNIIVHGGKTCHSMTGIFYACNFDIRRFSYPCVGVLMHPQP